VPAWIVSLREETWVLLVPKREGNTINEDENHLGIAETVAETTTTTSQTQKVEKGKNKIK